jgi:erythromycin esterase
MKLPLLITLLSVQLWSQPVQKVLELNRIDSLLTRDAKTILDKGVNQNQIIFLGESEHHIGSDLLAKTEFVKYLVSKHNIRNIVFEADFFALYFEHDKRNVYPLWSQSDQCEELFKFLDSEQVTIWGMDSNFSSPYSFQFFYKKLFEYLDLNKISYSKEFKGEVLAIMENGSKAEKVLSKAQLQHLFTDIDNLQQIAIIKENKLWYQIIESFKAVATKYTSNRDLGILHRDRQMASNLNFLAHELKDSKLIVWAANAHISKLDLPFMINKTMGYQFREINPNNSYHIAFSSIKMPYRKSKFIESQRSNPDNLLNLLPGISSNYILESIAFSTEERSKSYAGMFGLMREKTPYLNHFDALVFISEGIRNSYFK